MKWSPQQDEALMKVDKWLKDRNKQVFYLAGYAGTGKTTLAKHFASNVDGKVMFAAYTGKAAHVLSTKGCPATTIHKLIYNPKGKSKQRLTKLQVELAERLEALKRDDAHRDREVIRLKREIEKETENANRMSFELNLESRIKDAELVIIDECSMVDERIGRDILSFGVPVLVLGDPAQLPPVGGGGYFTERTPDMMLTEIHRQAQDSPIIHMATLVRNGKRLKVGAYGNCNVHPIRTPMEEIARSADQILCGRNKTRTAANARIRQFMGFHSALPLASDRMVCLKNSSQAGVLNGQIWIAASDAVDIDGECYEFTAYNEDSENQSPQEMQVWINVPQWDDGKGPLQFDYGYCLTCHKSQGSQWDHVLVMNEAAAFRKHARRWLYTAITRAAEKLDVVEMP